MGEKGGFEVMEDVGEEGGMLEWGGGNVGGEGKEYLYGGEGEEGVNRKEGGVWEGGLGNGGVWGGL